MHATGALVDQLRQLVGVGVLQLGHAAVIHDYLGQGVFQGQFLQHRFGGGRRALGRLLDNRDFQFFVEYFTQLFGAGQVEFLPGDFKGLFLQLGHALGEELALVFEQGGVHVGAVALDAAEHGDQWQFDIAEHLWQSAFVFQFRPQALVQAQGNVCIFSGVGAGFFQPYLIEGELLGALAGDFFKADGLVAQVLERQGVHVVAGGNGIEYVGFQHGVEGHAAQGDTRVFGEHAHVVLQVLADFLEVVVFENRFQCIEDKLLVELVWSARVVVAEGNVGGLARFHCHAHAHQFCLHVVEAGGFGIEGKHVCVLECVNPGIEGGFIEDGFVAFLVDALYGLTVGFKLYFLAGVFSGRVLAFQQFTEPAFEFQAAVVLGQLFRVRGLQL